MSKKEATQGRWRCKMWRADTRVRQDLAFSRSSAVCTRQSSYTYYAVQFMYISRTVYVLVFIGAVSACVRVTDTPDELTHAQQWRTPLKKPERVLCRRIFLCAAVCAVCKKDR